MVDQKEQELEERTATAAKEADVAVDAELEEEAFEPEETQLTSSRHQASEKKESAGAGF